MDELKPAGVWTQILLLLQKNLKTKRREEKKKLVGELLVPVLYLALLSYFVSTMSIKTYPKETTEFEKATDVVYPYGVIGGDIHVAPDNVFVRNFTAIMDKKYRLRIQEQYERLTFKYYSSAEELEEAYKKASAEMLVALVLPEGIANNFSYTIRMNPAWEYAPSVKEKKTDLSTCRGQPSNVLEQPDTCPVNKYYKSMFLGIQTLVEETIKYVREPSGDYKVEVSMQNYPKEEFCAGMPSLMRVLIPVYSIIPLVQIVNNLLLLIVTEKENKVKDGLRMVGASDLAYWLSWLGMYGIIVVVLASAYAIIFHVMNVIKDANPVLLFLLVLLFGLSGISFSFTLTPFFHKPKTAGLVGTLLLQVTSLLFVLQTFVGGATATLLIPLRLISSVAFTTALDEACGLICTGGIGFADLYPGGRGEGTFWSLIFLVFDILFYTFLAMYLDNVMPNEYGVRQHPLYFLKRGTSVNNFQTDRARLLSNGSAREGSISEHEDMSVERVSEEMASRRKIVIKDVRKTYKSWYSKTSVEAVQGISMEVYEGQITAILGKNGAGKSTLLNILAGLVTPTSGQAVILGLDASNSADMAKLRKKLGVCLQTDLHFGSLTVEEHLRFYAKLRGIPKERLEKEVHSIIDELGLHEKKDVTSAHLSGGQRRKLSVGIALIGNPQIILLDEPTAGFDPVSRRHLWSLLQHKKENRIILLTTHFMDEADVLADRKAIVHEGALKCLGSSLFLKNRYGVGYYLTLEMNNPVNDAPEIDSIIRNWVPQALDTRKIVANEVKYALPQSEASKFSPILQEIEQLITTKHACKSYGVSMTSLEDVFLKISSDVDVNNDRKNISEQEHNLVESCGELRRNYMDIFFALCLMRLKRLWRSPQALFFMIFMPNIFLIFGLFLMRVQASMTGFQTLYISNPKGIYPDLKLAVHESNSSEFLEFLKGKGVNATEYSGKYEELLNIYPGEGTAAAISLLAEDQLPFNKSLKALMRINGTYLHIPAVVLNLLTAYFGRLNPEQESLLKYETFPSNNDGLLLQTSVYSIFLLGPVYVFAFVGMVMEVVRDREVKVRDHLRINGLSFGMYFSSVFAIFGGLSLLVTLLLFVLIWVFPIQAFANLYASLILIFMLTLFIFPALMLSAAFSYCFNKMESAQSIFSQIVSWSSTILGIAILLLDNFVNSRTIVLTVHFAAALLDVFYVPVGLFYYMNKQFLQHVNTYKSSEGINFGTYNIVEIWGLCVVLLIQFPLFWSLLIFADVVKNGGSAYDALSSFWFGRTQDISPRFVSHNQVDEEELDEDIVKEKDRVKRYITGEFGVDVSKCVVAVEGLRKSYKVKKVVRPVIRGVDFMVEESEIFGLLGHNGAGKTTLMKIITAEEAPNSGNVKLCNQSITSNLSTAFHQLGFCPQHDALWENITIREHLMFYATMRGIEKERQTSVADHFLRGLQIEEHGDKNSQTLSGGTKRKLSYAMSMLGNPRIVLLDEPSTGMDPQSKRFLWNTVLGSFKENRGAILTTHSMEEADILCSRIAIMVKGQLLCVGSPQHLKTKYGTGYTMEIKVKANVVTASIPSDCENASNAASPMRRLAPGTSSRKLSDSETMKLPHQFRFIQEYFPAAEIVENFGDRGIFSIPKSGISSISQAFAVLESLKAKHDIEEYSFSQTSLEQVFLSFAKFNEEDSSELDVIA